MFRWNWCKYVVIQRHVAIHLLHSLHFTNSLHSSHDITPHLKSSVHITYLRYTKCLEQS